VLLQKVCVHDKYFRKIAKGICKSKSVGDDIVQEMYLKLNRYDQTKLADIIENKAIKFVGVRMIKQLFCDKMKRRKTHISLDNITLIQETIEADPREEVVEQALEGLYWYDKKMFELYVYDDHSMRSLQKKTGIPLSEIWQTINRAKEQIKEQI